MKKISKTLLEKCKISGHLPYCFVAVHITYVIQLPDTAANPSDVHRGFLTQWDMIKIKKTQPKKQQ